MTSTLTALWLIFLLTILPMLAMEAWSNWLWQEDRLRGYRKRYGK